MVFAAVPEGWRNALAGMHPARTAIGAAAVVILAIVWTWKRQIDRFHFTLTGRVLVGTVMALSAVAVWFFAALLAVVTLHHPPARVFIDAWAPWVLGVVMVARLIAAGWAIREVVQGGFECSSGRRLSAWPAGCSSRPC